MARMVSLMGNPPPDILSRSDHSPEFFDEERNFKPDADTQGILEGTDYRSLEEEEHVLEGEEKEKFLAFMRRILQWKPEDRPTAQELLTDPWMALE